MASDPDQHPQGTFAETSLVPGANGYLIQDHAPRKLEQIYHHHASVEVNLLITGRLRYTFSDHPVDLTPGHFTLFWGAAPHSVTHADAGGRMINIYLPLSELLAWHLPGVFRQQILGGAVIENAEPTADDAARAQEWARRDQQRDPAWQGLILAEIRARILRFALEPYRVLKHPTDRSTARRDRPLTHVDSMLSFVADNYARPITIADVARALDLSPGYASALFRRGTGMGLREYLLGLRLAHARMLLVQTDDKVLSIALDSGFGSVSQFYEIFSTRTGLSPTAYRDRNKWHKSRNPEINSQFPEDSDTTSR